MRIIQLSLFSLLLSVFAACEIHADEWQEVSRNSDLAIYTRHRSGTQLEELRAVGELDAPAAKVHSTLADVASYPEFMPYMKESRLLSTDNQLCYMLLSPPIVGARDYTIRVHRGTQKDNSGSTTYYSHWELANSEGPPPRPGVARVNINEGSWLLEPIGNRTKATYSLYTDGGGIPALLVNLANKQSVSRLFEALRERVRNQTDKR